MLDTASIPDVLYILASFAAVYGSWRLLKKQEIRLNWKLILFPVVAMLPVLALSQRELGGYLFTKIYINIVYYIVSFLCLLPIKPIRIKVAASLALLYAALAPVYMLGSMFLYLWLFVVFGGDLCG